MRKKVMFLFGMATLVALLTFNINLVFKGNNVHLTASSIMQMAVAADVESSKEDEKDVCMKQSCDNGTTCECTGC